MIRAAFFLPLLLAAAVAVPEREALLKKIQTNPTNSDDFVDLANTLQSTEKVTLLPMTFTREELYLLALRLDPRNAVALNNLGIIQARAKDTVTLPDGAKLTKQELFLRAIEVDPKFGHAYSNLGETMANDQKVNYPDGRSLSRKDLFVKSIELDATYPYAYNNLGLILAAEVAEKVGSGVVSIPGGEEALDARKCFRACISQGDTPVLGQCYKNLGDLMDDTEKVPLIGDEADFVDKAECLRRSKVYRALPEE